LCNDAELRNEDGVTGSDNHRREDLSRHTSASRQ